MNFYLHCKIRKSSKVVFLKKLEDISFLCGAIGTPIVDLELVTSVLGFKARVDPLVACFLTCVQWIPQIHLWCDTYRPLGGH